jgi:hypothetical protein
MIELITEINKISGVKYVLPFDKTLVISFEDKALKSTIKDQYITSELKKIVREHGFNMLTTKKTKMKKIISIIKNNN